MVYGSTVSRLRNDQVKILSFNRFEGFEALLQSAELRLCRDALERAGQHVLPNYVKECRKVLYHSSWGHLSVTQELGPKISEVWPFAAYRRSVF